MVLARLKVLACCLLVGCIGLLQTEASQWNVGGVVRMFNSKQGLKKEWEKDGYPCISSAGTSDGETFLVQTKADEVCVGKTTTGAFTCYATEGDIVGPVYARHQGSTTFIYSTASDSYSFEATTGKSTPFNLQGKSADAYMTAYGSMLYIVLDSCPAGLPSDLGCVAQANAVGGVLIGLSGSSVLKFVRTSTEIISSTGHSFTLTAAEGSFVDWQFDKDVLGVHASNAYVLLSGNNLSEQQRLTGSYLYGSMTSIKFNSGRERTVAVSSASMLEIYDVDSTSTTRVAKTAISDPGHILGLIKPEYMVFTGSQKALMVLTSNFASNEEGGVDISFKDTSVPFPSTASANPSSCRPLLLTTGTLGSQTTYLQAYSGSVVRTFSRCDTTAGDSDCVKPESVTVDTGNGGIIIAIAIALSFAIVPSSIYAYRERQYCLAKPSEVPETEVYYDREKGVSYDPAYEAYANQFTETKKRRGKAKDEDEDE